MGLASVSTASEGIQFCIFDLRRGQNEGQELDKILFFFPADLPFSTQLSVIGLSEGLITFTRIFSPEAACEVIEAERHSHVFYEAEADIWMVMVVEKSKEGEAIWRIEALRKVLKEVHSLFVMFYGSVRAMLEKEPSGGLIRSHLYSFIMDYLSVTNCQHIKSGLPGITAAGVMLKSLYQMPPLDLFYRHFLAGKKLQLPSFRDCLKERGTVQMLTVGREAAIEVQIHQVLSVTCQGTGILCWEHTLPLTDSISGLAGVDNALSCMDDTINLFTYAVQRLTPHALYSGASSWSYLRRASASSHAGSVSTLAHSGSASEQIYRSRDVSPSGDNNYHVTRPLQHGKWSKGNDGFLVSDIWGVNVGSSMVASPTVWLQQTEERMYLCPYQYKGLTLILLIPVSSILNGEQGVSAVKQQVLENVSSLLMLASLKILKVEEKLSKGWGGENAYHVSGYRYLLVDGDRNISRASPPGKVTTLTKESLLAMSKLREEVDLEKGRAKWENAGLDKDLEVCIRAKNNAWVIARITRGKELYMVLEKANETLLYASDAFEKFSSRYCNGAFSLD
ncbi:hypothetical protein JRO89_XS05G0205500 [Xanthoceras sorbifolium]|uniref:CCZ1/INTU/HSP4 first Longin domain-containing protein n=1 Tax=Xanthoceras sorbifolium TaxID=99658 RepID=A0ABQ8I2K7_9ROSI|nr:hypothetical protein JRO89_XS05G0205500 [Xanthoceras sorbifolium]